MCFHVTYIDNNPPEDYLGWSLSRAIRPRSRQPPGTAQRDSGKEEQEFKVNASLSSEGLGPYCVLMATAGLSVKSH